MIVLAKQRGVRVIADAKPSETELVRSYGAESWLPAASGSAAACVPSARRRGRAVRHGGAGSRLVPGHPRRRRVRTGARLGQQSIRAEYPHPAGVVLEALTRTDWLNELRDLASSGAITLRVAGEYPPERAADAHRAMEAGGLRGRGIIVF